MPRRMSPAFRRYVWRMWATMLAYFVLLMGSLWVMHAHPPSGGWRYLIAVVPAAPLVLTIVWIAQLMYGNHDEFQRTLWAEAMLWAAAATMAATTVWGFLENAGAPHVALTWVFPFFTAATLLGVRVLSGRYQ